MCVGGLTATKQQKDRQLRTSSLLVSSLVIDDAAHLDVRPMLYDSSRPRSKHSVGLLTAAHRQQIKQTRFTHTRPNARSSSHSS